MHNTQSTINKQNLVLDTENVNFAVIFDMDGTLIDNTPYHFIAWQQLFKKYKSEALNKQTYLTEISGVPIANTIKKFFNPNIQPADLDALVKEKQQLYQAAFKPYLKLIPGLQFFLAQLKSANIKVALATSSNIEDVDFIFNNTLIRQCFDAIVTGNMVNEAKPSPQIFLKAAGELNTPPEKCVVFEDSLMGLQAGNNAGMKVIGITTAHPASVIATKANLAINNYTDIDVNKLAALF